MEDLYAAGYRTFVDLVNLDSNMCSSREGKKERQTGIEFV